LITTFDWGASGDPDVEKARAKFKQAKEIEETFHKDFDGIGLG
jgi:hypothetical protein